MIVGSTALEYFEMNRCFPKDVDIWTDDPEYESPEGDDWHLIPTAIMDMIYDPHGYCTPDQIYTIKCSHAVWDIMWDKTKLDILWLKANGCKIIPELYKALIEHWTFVHGNKNFLSLNKSKDDFFDDNVNYVEDHDYLHQLVAYPNAPVYTTVLKDGEDVLIDKDKFFAMPLELQVKMFREEMAVIACERWLIDPRFKDKISWYKAHVYSVRKTITTLTKGVFSRFLVENLEHFVKPEYKYVKHLIETLGLER